MASFALTKMPVRVTSAQAQPLRLAADLGAFGELTLCLRVLEGSAVSVRLITGDQAQSELGWVELDSFWPMDAAEAQQRTVWGHLRYLRWEVTSAGNATFHLSGVGRRVRGFVPSDIAGCEAWLRADTVTLSGSNVTQMTDRSGRGNHATPPGTAPTFVSSRSSLNGRPAVLFATGVNDRLVCPYSAGAAKDYTIVSVFDTDSASGQNYIQDWDSSGGTRLIAAHRTGSGTGSSGYYDGSWRDIAAAVTGSQKLTWLLQGSTGELFRDGVSLGTAAYSQRQVEGFDLVNQVNGNVWLAEHLLYSRGLTADEIGALDTYLEARYG